jgi:hypothetical protein
MCRWAVRTPEACADDVVVVPKKPLFLPLNITEKCIEHIRAVN